LSHYFEPLKLPTFASALWAGGLELSGHLNSTTVFITLGVLFLIVAIRTVLFFEFKVHEGKERKLIDTLLLDGAGWEATLSDIRHDIKHTSEEVGLLFGRIGALSRQLDGHEMRLRHIESSPLITRILQREATPPAPDVHHPDGDKRPPSDEPPRR
jgi:hypothetical protein